MKETIALAFLVAAAVVAVYVWKSGETAGGRPRRSAVAAVEARPVVRSTVRDVRTYTGSVRPRSYFTVAPKVAGRLERLTVNIGDSVRRSELVALIEDDEFARTLEQARAGLAVAQATLEQTKISLAAAKRDCERSNELRAKGIASQSELDATRTRYEAEEAMYKVALAQVAQQEAALKVSEVRLHYTRISALWPVEGDTGSGVRYVGERFVDEGAMLRANEALVSIVDIDTVIAVIHVIERDYARMSPGQEVRVTADAFPDRVFTGRVVRIAPLLKETSRQARVEVQVGNPEHLLKPGMFARSRIVFQEHPDAVTVPDGALVRRDGRQGVFLVETQAERDARDGDGDGDGDTKPGARVVGGDEPAEGLCARFVPVQVGIVDGGMVEVIEPELSGLVVTLGQHLLEDGAPVILSGNDRPASPPAAPPGGQRGGDGRRPGGHP